MSKATWTLPKDTARLLWDASCKEETRTALYNTVYVQPDPSDCSRFLLIATDTHRLVVKRVTDKDFGYGNLQPGLWRWTSKPKKNTQEVEMVDTPVNFPNWRRVVPTTEGCIYAGSWDGEKQHLHLSSTTFKEGIAPNLLPSSGMWEIFLKLKDGTINAPFVLVDGDDYCLIMPVIIGDRTERQYHNLEKLTAAYLAPPKEKLPDIPVMARSAA